MKCLKLELADEESGTEPKQGPAKTWTCRKCFGEFRTRKLLSQHRKNLHPPETVTPEQRYGYTYSENENAYSCRTCDTEAQTREEIEAHILCHEEKLRCSVCDETMYSPYKFSVHMQKHSEDAFFRCPLCNYATLRISSILQHINLKHLRKYSYHCGHCGKGFSNSSHYREHVNNHLGVKPFTCVVCSREFAFSSYLFMHQVRNHRATINGVPLENQCRLCKKVFSKRVTLERHVKKHAPKLPGPKVHLCDICGKGYAIKNKLTLHYRVHTGYKPHQCSYCEKSFTKKEYLVMHERIHSGEKPYTCEYCGKCFNQDASLRIHVRSHTGERPVVCHICNAGFISKTALKHHFKTCTG